MKEKSKRVALAQFGASEKTDENIERVAHYAAQAQGQGAQMLCLPEYTMYCAEQSDPARVAAAAQPLDGAFVHALGKLARAYHLWIAAGMYEHHETDKPYNTIVILDAHGRVRGSHRKNRLFDQNGFGESLCCTAGTQPFMPIDTPIGKLGLLTCYELRFAQIAAEQRARGAQVLLVPAGWVEGEHKSLQWRTLLAARAIENSIPVLGVDQYIPERFVGHTAAFSPSGQQLGALSAGEGLLTIEWT